MAGGRVYSSNNSSNTTNNNLSVLFQKQSVPNPPSSDPLFIPGSFFGTRPMVSFGDVNGSFLRRFDEEENGDDDLDEYFHQPEKKRRLTVDQVQFLEKSFEVENKLEPERKIQLAKDLGLQPRQVAVWFQNRRARWKTKQLEKDYETLQASFNSLKADYDNLLKDKDKLKQQVLQLTNKLIMKETVTSDVSGGEPPEKPSEVVVELVCKQEGVMSSSKSDIFDSDSPYYTDGVNSSILEAVDSSYPFQSDHSDDVTQDDELHPASYIFPKLEDDDYSDPPASSCNYGFHVGEHAFWSSSY